jgi:phosphopantothenoylcysteine decarboxylase/phosphopantothenate--cysteine ligase
VVQNRETLQKRGVRFLGPDSGHLACGEVGDGRFAEPSEIAFQAESYFGHFGQWRGKKVLVTAGPTQEPIDPVRMITNHSSGKMGYALAQAALNRGAEVILISGPTRIVPPPVGKLVWVRTAKEMHQRVFENLTRSDVVIMAAAVADYRVENSSKQKIKKNLPNLTLRFEKNPDILEGVLKRKGPSQVVVGFAAETEHLEKNALAKWKKKPCDLLVANRVGEGMGFEGDQNELLVFSKKATEPIRFKKDFKSRLAEKLLDLV